MHTERQTYWSTRNDYLLNVRGQHQTAKNERELVTLIETIRIFSDDIGMELGTEKMCPAVA